MNKPESFESFIKSFDESIPMGTIPICDTAYLAQKYLEDNLKGNYTGTDVLILTQMILDYEGNKK